MWGNNMMSVCRRPIFGRHITRFLGSSSRGGDEKEGDEPGDDQHYFHIAPSGDWWTGPSIFAAKHLQSDYVKSIKVPADFDPELVLGDDRADPSAGLKLLYKIYDDGELPSHLVEKGRKKE
mmetsp:Transcript_22087/g.50116  ORF Transcript_22087/g.50116 Transcript_22087/m.50116 type:complete len:121 (+) Transcript_22087:121-483(+)